MKNTNNVISVFLAAVSLISCGEKKVQSNEAPLVDVVTVKNSNEIGSQSFTGKTKPAEEVNLAFKVAGQIQRVLVKEGDYVRAGQVVAVMDSRDYNVQLSATQAEYEQIKADAERVMALYQEGNTTASNYDKARYGLQQISQKLEHHKNQLADTQLRSSINGYVQAKLHESGETVAAGMPVISIFASGDTEVEIKFSAADFANIDKFTSFYCKFDITGDEQFPLTISRTSQEANSSQLYTVRLKFATPVSNKRITPGMTTMVYSETINKNASNVFYVPSSAVVNNNDKTIVYVYDEKQDVVKARQVSLNKINRDGTSIIDKGLKQNEKIVVTGVHHIKDGQKVRLMQKPSSSNIGGLL
ncbi:MAG: efflux RND transporter periplasmic adaptor subunit [Bacteroidaceae bacterium]|nr:efflux RND transporter periplasmic adaptor subunit [Bacteroidaceae bacterium]